ncbi:fumarylacetoacetate hydrolase family protein [Microbacterium sp. BH-3-3-3]|uniref:fumarylacetoacetate hydrolase family protein n=1 Tax=Microbacterium sp. BH-3-3-3 TaxID=1906742 RepID=UPI0021B695C5|nr:fumarylacetoacetate hydrolase family protein [Microbacterium sp. BH-3-3-3]
MRLARIDGGAGERSVAVVAGATGDHVLDLGPRPLSELFAELDGIRDLIETTDAETLPTLDPSSLRAPVRPRILACLGYNYRGHVPDGVDPTTDDPATPDVFVKTANTLGGPNDPVVVPAVADDVDYEGEVAVVIGRRAHAVPLAEAMSYVAGYTVLNDVSDRSWQRKQSQWALGKCFDGFAPLGPWLVTADEVDPQDLLVEVVRDGVVTVSQSTATTIFSVAFVVHHLSQVMTLEPGDVVSTGTPQKLPDAQEAHRPLAPGDAVTVRISGLGEFTTTFVAPPGDSA